MIELEDNFGYITLNEGLDNVKRCFLTHGMSDTARLVPILVGAPGAGKSSILKQFRAWANTTEKERGHPGWEYFHFRLAQHDPTDVKGIPHFNQLENGRVTSTWALTDKFPVLGDPESAQGKYWIIFLDEFLQAPPSMQNIAANLIDGIIGDHELDLSRIFFVLASNDTEHGAGAFEVLNNVKTRLHWSFVETSIDEWIQGFAVPNGIPAEIMGFVMAQNHYFNQQPAAGNKTYACPRTWEMVSLDMRAQGENWYADQDRTKNFVTGCIGHAAAQAFTDFVWAKKDSFTLDRILAGDDPQINLEMRTAAVYTVIIEANLRIEAWVKEAMKKEAYLQAAIGLEKDKALAAALGENYGKINRIYEWMAGEGMEPAFQLLLNSLQSKEIARVLRNAFAASKATGVFETAGKAYDEILNNIRPVVSSNKMEQKQ